MARIDDLRVVSCISLSNTPSPTQSVILPPRENDAHITLTHVSSTWRNVALSDPSLWDTFSFSNRSFSTRQKFMDVYDALLKRSEPYPLLFIIVTDSVLHTQGSKGTSNGRVADLVYGYGHIGVVQDILGRPLARLRQVDFIISNVDCSGFLENVPFSDFSAIEMVDEYFLEDVDLSRPSLRSRKTAKHDMLVRVVVTKGILLL
ncbi:hypothetical protein CPB84DRAFT_1851293 [Gymnopilus junonius]|uniref:F-box domain-containing protein n=1 Tax=Gymnopilus junonius TaxID=109634 RepID=A0A9P5NGJ0_GYMJU|nr:hypothetical protein CPB84DRAFT_1851293 [Gymnopilus junonius]